MPITGELPVSRAQCRVWPTGVAAAKAWLEHSHLMIVVRPN